MSEFIGTMIVPSPDDVRDGIGVGSGGVEFIGNMVLPLEHQVSGGIGYGSGAVEFTGAYSGTFTINNNIDLFISGVTNNIANDIDLFIPSKDNKNQELDLFIHGPEQITDNITLSIHGTVSCLPVLETGDDNFGITLDELFKNADYNPQIIGRFIGDPNSVTIEVWSNGSDVIILNDNNCYQIGDTGRWAWSTINLPPLAKIINQFIYRMTGDNAETFESQFILHTRRKNSYNKVPRDNSHIRKI